MTWTEEQQAAISERGRSIIVSAAAGSGKTAVLVERVIERILSGGSIDRLLIVTFTVAAAGEMRERISAAISNKLVENPSSRHLRRQSILIHSAKICTIDSFCLDLVRSNFQELGISPDFRIADEAEIELLKEELCTQVLEDYYDDIDNNNFELVAESFTSGRDDIRLYEIILSLHSSLSTAPYPHRWLDKTLHIFNPSNDIALKESLWFSEINDYVLNALRAICMAYENIQSELIYDEKLYNALRDMLSHDKEQLESICKTLESGDFDRAGEMLNNMSFDKMNTPRGYGDNPLKLNIASLRERTKGLVATLKDGIFALKSSDYDEDRRLLYPVINSLFNVVKEFDKRFEEKKREKNIFTFNDIERLAFNLLISDYDEESGTIVKTSTAQDLSACFDEIMVDEYQDTNSIQDKIFLAASKNGENLFTVGDVKQSIYRFRKAEPGIFLNRKRSGIRQDGAQTADKALRLITLSKNFRSRDGILSFVNFIFSQLMSEDLGEMEYDKDEMLYPGADYPDTDEPCVEVDLLMVNDSESSDNEDNDDEADDFTLAEKEAAYIAGRIKAMYESGYMVYDKKSGCLRQSKLSDYCILMRSITNSADIYLKALHDAGLNGYCESGGSYFQEYEVSLILSLLAVIDNPYRDIHLAAVMRSPLFGFTSDELARIRLKNRRAKFYEAVLMSSADNDKRCSDFVSKLEELRLLARNMPVHKLIWHIYTDSSFFGIVGGLDRGAQRQENLRQLYRHAKNYEKNGLKGLYGFISFVNRIIEKGSGLSAVKPMPARDAVRIMSIHKSKGLEFPICIIAACEKKFNMTDLNAPLLIHSKVGVGVKLRDISNKVEYTTFSREAIKIAMKRECLSEEMRVLYVAMTRAKEKLIIVSGEKKLESCISKLSQSVSAAGKPEPSVLLSSARSIDWLLLCLLRHPDCAELRSISNSKISPIITDSRIKLNITSYENASVSESKSEPEAKAESFSYQDIEKQRKLIERRLDFIYPHALLSHIPAKLSVSELKGRRSYDADEDVEYLIQPAVRYSKPKFLEDKKLTGAQKGTALHRFMQFAYYTVCENGGIDAEIARLVAQGYISKAEGEAVDKGRVHKFFKSELYKRIAISQNVVRECRFNIDIPAYEYDKALYGSVDGDERIMLQGVIDCFFEENDGIVLVDYKTDRVNDNGESLIENYSLQLKYYSQAIERLMGKMVKEKYIYSFALNRALKVKG